MMPRFEDKKIWIVESNELKKAIEDPNVVWIQCEEASKCFDNRLVVDPSHDNTVKVFIVDTSTKQQEKVFIFQCEEEDKIALVDAIVSKFVREQIMDLDFADMTPVFTKTRRFSVLKGDIDSVLAKLPRRLEEIRQRHSINNDKMIVQIDGDISVFDLPMVLETVDAWNEKNALNLDIYYSSAYDEKKENTMMISMWF